MNILPDTSIWIDFLRRDPKTTDLSHYLTERKIVGHPWIFGELIMGDLGPQRHGILKDYLALPLMKPEGIPALARFVEKESLFHRGLSLIDAQILLSCIQTRVRLWTHDRKLARFAQRYRINSPE